MSTVATSRLSEIRQEVDAELIRYYDERLQQAGAMHEDYAVLWQTMKTLGLAGGKRLRPYVMLLVYEGLEGKDHTSVLPVAVALEVLHASLLIHDDIIDRDYKRYGQANIAGQYRERYAREVLSDDQRDHYANMAALLAGDLALSGAYELILRSSLSNEQKVTIAQLLSEAIFSVAGGELLDTEAVLLPFESVDTFTIAELKTASYSFVNPLQIAAALAGVDDSVRQSLAAMGRSIGIAYQLADDVLGLLGDEAETGKPITSDVAEGKRTYLMQRTLQLCTHSERMYLQEILTRGSVTEHQLEEVRSIVRSSGALAETKALMRQYADEARRALAAVPLKESVRAELEVLIHRAVERRS